VIGSVSGGAKVWPSERIFMDSITEKVVIGFAANISLPTNVLLTLTVSYDATASSGSSIGLFRSSFTDVNGDIHNCLDTNFAGMHARRALALMDDLAFASAFDLSITVSTGQVVLILATLFHLTSCC
jgi:hypothetical protein